MIGLQLAEREVDSMSQTATSEVLTLEESANYLKLPLETIEREASRGHIPLSLPTFFAFGDSCFSP